MTSDRIAVQGMLARTGSNNLDYAHVMQTARDALLQRFDVIRISPSRILDLGAGTGAVAHALTRRFRKAEVISVDPVVSLLYQAKSYSHWFSRQRYIAAKAERLPFSPGSMDLIVSNLAMPWFDSIDDGLAECLRTLRPGGLFLFSTFGPGTLKELALAWLKHSGSPRFYPFVDMHVVGDMMVRTGFKDVVMDVERIQFKALNFRQLWRALDHSGISNVLAFDCCGLSSPTALRVAATRYESMRYSDGTLPVSVEFVFGHAWVSQRSQPPCISVFPQVDWSLEPRLG